MTLPDILTVIPSSLTTQPRLRMGILGAARITPSAIIDPARSLADIQVLAVAARDPERARRFAAAHQIPRVHTDYAGIIDDPAVDAVYIPLPNSLHRTWALAALCAGKHVLCEKPLASNAHEAHEMVAASEEHQVVLMEAFHYAFHPLAQKVLSLLHSGAIGSIRQIDSQVCVPGLRLNDIRYQFELAGGATMDVGCYALHASRLFAGQTLMVTRARANLISGQVDRAMQADFAFPNGATGTMFCSLLSRHLLRAHMSIVGERGILQIANPILPHLYNRLSVQTPERSWTERIPGATTYTYQLRIFVDRIRAIQTGTREKKEAVGGAADCIANMKAIDAVYDAAGLARRGSLLHDSSGNPA